MKKQIFRITAKEKKALYRDYEIIPSLSELIKACGTGFWALFQDNTDCWYARKEVANGEDFKGSTPEEAVASLYIALHRSKEELLKQDKNEKVSNPLAHV